MTISTSNFSNKAFADNENNDSISNGNDKSLNGDNVSDKPSENVRNNFSIFDMDDAYSQHEWEEF